MSIIWNFVVANQEELISSFVIPFVVFTIAKFPDPRNYEDKWWYVIYYVFFAIATRYSGAQWDKVGGVAKIPGFQFPKLYDVQHPKANLGVPTFWDSTKKE